MPCHLHVEHHHSHIAGCGHVTIEHHDHRDYLHDGCLHFLRDDEIDEHTIPISEANPVDCTPDHHCEGHAAGHRHAPGCGHPPVPHGDHQDFLVGGHLHHPHGVHCDDHGEVFVRES
jgi:hypothetical protein